MKFFSIAFFFLIAIFCAICAVCYIIEAIKNSDGIRIVSSLCYFSICALFVHMIIQTIKEEEK